MKNLTLIFLFTFFGATNLHSQESYINNRWTFKLAYANYQTNVASGANFKYETTGNYQLEANYGFLNFLESGIYAGYSSWCGNNILYTYGANINAHILPFFIHARDFRFDAYVTGKIGGNIWKQDVSYDNIRKYNNILEYGVGLGATFYPFKHFGVFAEYSFGKYFFNDNKKFRAGIVIKLNK